MGNKTKWDSLSIREKADLMKLFVDNGITDLNQIHSLYNEYDKGGFTNQIDNNQPTRETYTGGYNTKYNVPLVPEWLGEGNKTFMEYDGTPHYNWVTDDIKNLIKEYESYRPYAYLDSKGYVTGGYGHKLTEEEIKKYWDSKKGLPKGLIPKQVSDNWFDSNINSVFDSVYKVYGENVPSNILAALVSLGYQGGDRLIRGKRDINGELDTSSSWGSPNFEIAVKRYMQEPTEPNLNAVINQMQYRDDNLPGQAGLTNRYGLMRAIMENIADPSKVSKYKAQGTFKGYKSNKVKSKK